MDSISFLRLVEIVFAEAFPEGNVSVDDERIARDVDIERSDELEEMIREIRNVLVVGARQQMDLEMFGQSLEGSILPEHLYKVLVGFWETNSSKAVQKLVSQTFWEPVLTNFQWRVDTPKEGPTKDNKSAKMSFEIAHPCENNIQNIKINANLEQAKRLVQTIEAIEEAIEEQIGRE